MEELHSSSRVPLHQSSASAWAGGRLQGDHVDQVVELVGLEVLGELREPRALAWKTPTVSRAKHLVLSAS